MKKHFIYILSLCISILSLTSCSFFDSTISPKEEIIGVVMPSQSLDRWNKDGAYLQEKFEEQGYNVLIAYSDNDAEQQVNDIQKMIEDGVDVLIIAAVDGTSLTDVLEQAKEKNITVISYDRLIMGTDAVTYNVTFDNYLVGQLQANYIIDAYQLKSATGKQYTMEIFSGDTADNNATLFYNGAMDTLKPYIESGTIQVLSGQQSFEETATNRWLTSLAETRMSEIIDTYYSGETKLDIVLCANDSCALGVTYAIDANYKLGNVPVITGQDGDKENLKNILDGKQSMTVFKAVSNEAAVTLNMVIFLLNGETPTASLISASGWNFKCQFDKQTYHNGAKIVPSYLITPEVVTIQNYKKILVDSGYYEIDEEGYLFAK